MRSIFGIFGRSPFGPLAKHSERVHETVQMIRLLAENLAVLVTMRRAPPAEAMRAGVLGPPISTTHTIVGAVNGVGLPHRTAALDLWGIGPIMNSWLATLPASAGLTGLLFVLLRAIFL